MPWSFWGRCGGSSPPPGLLAVPTPTSKARRDPQAASFAAVGKRAAPFGSGAGPQTLRRRQNLALWIFAPVTQAPPAVFSSYSPAAAPPAGLRRSFVSPLSCTAETQRGNFCALQEKQTAQIVEVAASVLCAPFVRCMAEHPKLRFYAPWRAR